MGRSLRWKHGLSDRPKKDEPISSGTSRKELCRAVLADFGKKDIRASPTPWPRVGQEHRSRRSPDGLMGLTQPRLLRLCQNACHQRCDNASP
jgi:hypothetical protein